MLYPRDDAKKFGKTLLGYLSKSNKTFTITSLSILSNLYLDDSVGSQIFKGENLLRMILLVYNVLIGNDDTMIRHYSIDLAIDFVRCEKTREVICHNKKLDSDTFQILNLMNSTDACVVYKVFELLIEYCKQPQLAQNLVKVFTQNLDEAETQLQSDVVLTPAQSLLHWISRTEREDTVVQTSILSLVFLRDFMELVMKSHVNKIGVYTQVSFKPIR